MCDLSRRLREQRLLALAVLRVSRREVRRDVHPRHLHAGRRGRAGRDVDVRDRRRARREGNDARRHLQRLDHGRHDRRLQRPALKAAEADPVRDRGRPASRPATLRPERRAVNHLSTRYVEFTRGDGDAIARLLRRDAEPERRHARGHVREAGLLLGREGQLARAARRQRQHRDRRRSRGTRARTSSKPATSRCRTRPRRDATSTPPTSRSRATLSVDPTSADDPGAPAGSGLAQHAGRRRSAPPTSRRRSTLFGPEILKLSADADAAAR